MLTTDSRSTLSIAFKNVVKHSQNFFSHKDMMGQKMDKCDDFFALLLVPSLVKKTIFFQSDFLAQIGDKSHQKGAHASQQPEKKIRFFQSPRFFLMIFAPLASEEQGERKSNFNETSIHRDVHENFDEILLCSGAAELPCGKTRNRNLFHSESS